MHIQHLSVCEALDRQYTLRIIDVRSPIEFNQGHIPGAVNLPLFTNKERALIGTTYKQQGQQAAIQLGYKICTPKIAHFVGQCRTMARKHRLLIHCWRGGMRSQYFAELLIRKGFEDIAILEGGYKAYRRHVHESFEQPARLLLIGGKTGSGKTAILHELQAAGEQTLDLEGLANHKGSAFGGIGQEKQPSSEQFENLIHAQWRKLDLQKTVWLEDESHSIGSARMPEALFHQMQASRVIALEIPLADRIERLAKEYAHLPLQELKRALFVIHKKLGPNFDEALDSLEQKEFKTAIRLTLKYYDKSYENLMKKKKPENILPLKLWQDKPKDNAQRLIAYAESLTLSERIRNIEKLTLAGL